MRRVNQLLKIISLVAAFEGTLHAEPWLSNKFAGNCAACHAPGRKNLPAKDRRCTLSCQGCHVNPNGGGLRSAYGKWNEDRWLSSFSARKFLAPKDPPAPLSEQKYAEASDVKTVQKLYLKYGAPLKTVEEQPEDLTPYSMANDTNHSVYLEGEAVGDWRLTVPEDDPYREMGRSKIDGGADFRYQLAFLKSERDVDDATTKITFNENWLMAGDINLRWRPVYRKVHVVLENRFLGQPTSEMKDWAAQYIRRSAYVLVDDLPYNSFGMAGIYRPLFGHYSPDHTSLAEVIKSTALTDTTRSYELAYEGLSIGASPNIPFGNLHILGRQYLNGQRSDQSHFGFAANLGARFVSYGFAPTYSFIYSKRDNAQGVEVKTLMHDITLGANYGRVTTNLDLIFYSRGADQKDYVSGTYLGAEMYVQTWRNIYAVGNLGYSTTSSTLKPGSSLQIRGGVRGFWLPGVDTTLMLTFDSDDTEKETPLTVDSDYSELGVQAQVHLFM